MTYAASEFWREAFALATVARYEFSAQLAAECMLSCGDSAMDDGDRDAPAIEFAMK